MIMDLLKKIFFYAFKEKKDVSALVVSVVIQVLVTAVLGIALGFLGGVPFVGFLFGLVGGLIDLYGTASVVLTFLDYFKVIK